MSEIKYSYDYDELIDEIEEDLEDGLITKDTVINIVRNREMQIDNTGYHPIIDYYLPDDLKMLEEPLEEFYNREEYSAKEWAELKKETEENLKQYKKDEPFFEQMTVYEVINEMVEWNNII